MRLGAPSWACSLSTLLVVTAWCTDHASAAEPPVSVLVDCPGLGEEQRAALESRANAELLVRRQPGTLVVVCDTSSVELRWRPSAGNVAEERVPMAAEARDTVERVLEALEVLLLPPADRSQQPVPPVANTKPAKRVEPAPPELVTSPLPPRYAFARLASEGDASPFFEIALGAALELWSAEVLGALGPRGRLLWALPSGWAISGGAGAAWTLRAPDDTSGRLLRFQAGAEYHLDRQRRLRIGAAALVDWLHVSREPDQDDDVVFGGILQAEYLLLEAPLQIALGPTISSHGAAVSVELGAREIFRIPAVALGLVAELTWGPL